MNPPPSPSVWYLIVEKTEEGKFEPVLAGNFLRKDIKTVSELRNHACKLVSVEGDWEGDWSCYGVYTQLPSASHFSFRDHAVLEIAKKFGIMKSEFFGNCIRRNTTLVLETLELKEDGQLIVAVYKSHKRAREPDTSLPNKRAKFLDRSPSQMAKALEYEELQKLPDEKLLDDRPVPDKDIPPTSLLYEGFGLFRDITQGHLDPPGLSAEDFSALKSAVDELAEAMTGFFDDENGRRSVALPLLSKIFKTWKGTQIPTVQVSAIGKFQFDGHNLAQHDSSSMVVEIKNRITGITSIPEVEMGCYAGQLNEQAKKGHSKVFGGWQVPCLGLTIVGHLITFYAIISNGKRLRIVSLTPTLSCIQSASDGFDSTLLHSAFAASCILQARILDDAKQLVETPPSPILSDSLIPSISRLQKYPPSATKEYVQFQIQDYYPVIQEGRLMYIAKSDNRQVLIKFVKRYCTALHSFCAFARHAPKLLAFEQLHGGYFGVAMEYIEPAERIAESKSLKENRDRWTAELKTLVEAFHEKNLVHGDLRAANIICDNNGNLMLVDFDWGGKADAVSYPTPNLHPDLLKGRAHKDLVIRKSDDQRILHSTITKLKSV